MNNTGPRDRSEFVMWIIYCNYEMATCLDLLQHLKHSPLNKKKEKIKLIKLKRNFFGPVE